MSIPNIKPIPCNTCGTQPEFQQDYYGVGWTAVCMECYDGAPDAGPQLFARGKSKAECVQYWNETVEDQG